MEFDELAVLQTGWRPPSPTTGTLSLRPAAPQPDQECIAQVFDFPQR